MSKIALTPNASGTGTLSIAAPDTNSDFTLTLPAESGTVLTSASDIDTQVASSLNATGSAPIYACRAWVNFDGTGTVAIRASGNVSSITDNGTGDYTVNFTTAMADGNYSPVFGAQADQISTTNNGNVQGEIARFSNALQASSARLEWGVGGTSSKYDPTTATVAIFR